MSSVPQPPRTYNQNHAPRKYTPGKRRVSIYWTWSYPWEANRNTSELDNRFSTMTEVRRVAWPLMKERNGRNALRKESLGHWNCSTVRRLHFRASQVKSPDILLQYFNESTRPGISFRSTNESSQTQTLMVFGLDHLLSEQEQPLRKSRRCGSG